MLHSTIVKTNIVDREYLKKAIKGSPLKTGAKYKITFFL